MCDNKKTARKSASTSMISLCICNLTYLYYNMHYNKLHLIKNSNLWTGMYIYDHQNTVHYELRYVYYDMRPFPMDLCLVCGDM